MIERNSDDSLLNLLPRCHFKEHLLINIKFLIFENDLLNINLELKEIKLIKTITDG